MTTFAVSSSTPGERFPTLVEVSALDPPPPTRRRESRGIEPTGHRPFSAPPERRLVLSKPVGPSTISKRMLISRLRIVFNLAEASQQLGLMPTPEPLARDLDQDARRRGL
jgi:hypothetical protein